MKTTMRQLSLLPDAPLPRSEERLVAHAEESEKPSRIQLSRGGASLQLAAQLSSLLREPVEVQLTDNAWTMVSYRRVQGRLHFRLHHMFVGAHEPVICAL